jgi:ParB family chromosome partitioning protein
MVSAEKLSMGHAKAILSATDEDDQFYLAGEIHEEGMNVRQAEDFVRKYMASAAEQAQEAQNKQKDQSSAIKETYDKYAKGLEGVLGTRVNIKDARSGGGKIEINYFTPQDLERIVKIINS